MVLFQCSIFHFKTEIWFHAGLIITFFMRQSFKRSKMPCLILNLHLELFLFPVACQRVHMAAHIHVQVLSLKFKSTRQEFTPLKVQTVGDQVLDDQGNCSLCINVLIC